MWLKNGNIFNKHWCQVPVVDQGYDDKWRIFYSQRIDNKSYPMFIDVEKNNPKTILNIADKPVLMPGKLGTFDQAGVMPTELINYNNKKYLYYIGWSNRTDVPYFNTLGLAISEDNGGSFNKFSNGPVFGCSYKEPGYIGTISILIENGIWRGWYLSCREWELVNNKPEPLYDIKYAESFDGIDWYPKNITCISRIDNEGGISQASVIKKEDTYYMWFSHRNRVGYRTDKSQSYKISLAISKDGYSWTRKSIPELDVSNEGWDSIMVEYPYVFESGENYYMFYNGNGFGKEGMGYATKKNTFSLW